MNELQCFVFSILGLGKTKINIVFLVQVKQQTSNLKDYEMGSHVMQYGDANTTAEKLYLYQGMRINKFFLLRLIRGLILSFY